MAEKRWRIEFVELEERLPVPWRPVKEAEKTGAFSGEPAVSALMGAFDLLARRGSGKNPWAASYRHNPVAFLLDAVSDADTLWRGSGELVYRNRAAEELGVSRGDEVTYEIFKSGGRRFERRCVRFRYGEAEFTLEIVRRVHRRTAERND